MATCPHCHANTQGAMFDCPQCGKPLPSVNQRLTDTPIEAAEAAGRRPRRDQVFLQSLLIGSAIVLTGAAIYFGAACLVMPLVWGVVLVAIYQVGYRRGTDQAR